MDFVFSLLNCFLVFGLNIAKILWNYSNTLVLTVKPKISFLYYGYVYKYRNRFYGSFSIYSNVLDSKYI